MIHLPRLSSRNARCRLSVWLAADLCCVQRLGQFPFLPPSLFFHVVCSPDVCPCRPEVAAPLPPVVRDFLRSRFTRRCLSAFSQNESDGGTDTRTHILETVNNLCSSAPGDRPQAEHVALNITALFLKVRFPSLLDPVQEPAGVLLVHGAVDPS